MERRINRSRLLALAAALMMLPALAQARSEGTKQESATPPEPSTSASEQKAQAGPTLDVEELNDSLAANEGKTVSVAGEVEDRLDGHSFILESGGIFDDEIVVVLPPGNQQLMATPIGEDDEIVVQGTLRTVSVIDIERELGWDLDPEIETELEGTRSFIVADRIRPQFD